MAHDLITTDPTPSVAKTCPKCGGKPHAMYSDDLLECAANHWKRNEERALAVAKDGATGEGAHHGWIYCNPDTGVEWSQDHPVESGQVDDAERVKAATAFVLHGYLIDAWNQLAAANAEIERLRGVVKQQDGDLNLFAQGANKRMDQLHARDAVLAQCEKAVRALMCQALGAWEFGQEALSAIAGLKERKLECPECGTINCNDKLCKAT